MRVVLNGERVEIEEGATIAAAVATSGAAPGARGLAVALDGEVVPRGEWHSVELSEDQRVEVLQAVQGG